MRSIIFIIFFIDVISAFGGGGGGGAGGCCAKRVNFLQIGEFKCEGKYGSNGTFTFYDKYSLAENCDPRTDIESGEAHLVECLPSGRTEINVLKILMYNDIPSGAYTEYEAYGLIQSGPLAGKTFFIKETVNAEVHTRRCSTALSPNAAVTVKQVILIADKGDSSIFDNPAGAFETFQRGCNTNCVGKSVIVS